MPDSFPGSSRIPSGTTSNTRRPWNSSSPHAVPLPPSLIGNALGWDRRRLRDLRQTWARCFPESEEGLRPFHKSLSDWLTNERLSGSYFTAIEDGHRALRKAGLRQWGAAPEKLDPYFKAHLPYHLANASQPIEAASILRDPQFLQHRCDAGFLFEAIQDYERLQDPALQTIGRALPASLPHRSAGTHPNCRANLSDGSVGDPNQHCRPSWKASTSTQALRGFDPVSRPWPARRYG